MDVFRCFKTSKWNSGCEHCNYVNKRYLWHIYICKNVLTKVACRLQGLSSNYFFRLSLCYSFVIYIYIFKVHSVSISDVYHNYSFFHRCSDNKNPFLWMLVLETGGPSSLLFHIIAYKIKSSIEENTFLQPSSAKECDILQYCKGLGTISEYPKETRQVSCLIG